MQISFLFLSEVLRFYRGIKKKKHIERTLIVIKRDKESKKGLLIFKNVSGLGTFSIPAPVVKDNGKNV